MGKMGVQAITNIVFDTAKRNNRKLYVIIDEYDHFANDLIAMGTRPPVSKNENRLDLGIEIHQTGRRKERIVDRKKEKRSERATATL